MNGIKFIMIYLLYELTIKINGISIPSIRDVFLKPIGIPNVDVTFLLNSTCAFCLCKFLRNDQNYQALNCLNNGTCELFSTLPLSYRLRESLGARFYFRPNSASIRTFVAYRISLNFSFDCKTSRRM